MYSDKDEIIERLSEIELIDLASETTTLDAAALAVIVTCIEDADDEIDGYISGRYTTPLTSPYPAMIVRISVELAIVNLNKKRNIFSEDVLDRYKWVKDMLEKIAKGTITIDVEDDASTPDRIEIQSNELRGW